MNTKTKYIAGAIVALLIVGGGAFYGGMAYGKTQAAAARAAMRGAGAAGGRFMAGANFITRDVLAKDAQSITVKDRTGSSRIVLYSASTEVSKFAAGTIDDVAVGKTIMVNGKTNTDGSITAQSIQIRPPMPVTPTTPAQ